MKRYAMLASALMMGTILAAGAVDAKSLVYCSEGSPENFTPAINTTGTSLDAARPVFNQLVEFERGSTNVIPGLAETWEVSPDGTVITFHLRKGVKFHSGVNGFTPSRDSTPRMSSFPSSGSGSPITRMPRFRAAPMTTSTTWACRIR